MSKRKQAPKKPKTALLIIAAAMIGAVIIGALLVAQRTTPSADRPLRDSETAFSVPTHVGQPAPGFTAIGVDGQPYTFRPGDGRPKAIVFYMGFG